MSRCFQSIVCCLLVACVASLAAAQQQLDPDKVYRVYPQGQRLLEAPPAEIRPGFVYKYYHSQLEQHVWGLATEDGQFEYAMGPGSMQSVDRFDLRLTPEQREQIIDRLAPRLHKALESTGRDFYLMLNDEDTWELYLSNSMPKVFDRLTGRRWEWHGLRRLSVVHTTGNLWRTQDGRYFPAVSHVVDVAH